MKRAGELFPSVVDFSNMLLAAKRAQLGKRFRNDVLAFNYDLERNLHRLRRELLEKTSCPGAYRAFVIYEPKRKLISAAPYRDRVVHHCLCNVIAPILDRALVDSCYANREGKGTHRALEHYKRLTRRYPFVLRADVRRYFPSMDHPILKSKIRRKIKCPETLWLIDLIIDNSNEQETVGQFFSGDDLLTPCERRHGLPIGNLTSQYGGNVYLNGLDHLLAERYGGGRYLRYMDDIALFSDSRDVLEEAQSDLTECLERLRLRPHPAKTGVLETRHGASYLGFRVFPDHSRVRQENLKRARRRLRQMQREFRDGWLSVEQLSQSVQSWIAHLSHGDTWRLRERIFSSLVFARG